MKTAAEQFNAAYMAKMRSGDGELPDVESAIQTAARDYQLQVQHAANSAAGDDEIVQKMESDIKEKGWLYLGVYYHTLATANTEMKDVANLKPVVSGMSNDGDIGSIDYFKGLFQAYHSQLKIVIIRRLLAPNLTHLQGTLIKKALKMPPQLETERPLLQKFSTSTLQTGLQRVTTALVMVTVT